MYCYCYSVNKRFQSLLQAFLWPFFTLNLLQLCTLVGVAIWPKTACWTNRSAPLGGEWEVLGPRSWYAWPLFSKTPATDPETPFPRQVLTFVTWAGVYVGNLCLCFAQIYPWHCPVLSFRAANPGVAQESDSGTFKRYWNGLLRKMLSGWYLIDCYGYKSTCGANKASLSKIFNLVCISQVSRSVSNFDAILPFYVDILGSTIVHQVDFEDFVE